MALFLNHFLSPLAGDSRWRELLPVALPARPQGRQALLASARDCEDGGKMRSIFDGYRKKTSFSTPPARLSRPKDEKVMVCHFIENFEESFRDGRALIPIRLNTQKDHGQALARIAWREVDLPEGKRKLNRAQSDLQQLETADGDLRQAASQRIAALAG